MGAILMTPSEHDDQLTSGSKVIDLGGQWSALITVDTVPHWRGISLYVNSYAFTKGSGSEPELDDSLDRGISYRSTFKTLGEAYEMARAFIRTRLELELQILTVHTTPKKGQ